MVTHGEGTEWPDPLKGWQGEAPSGDIQEGSVVRDLLKHLLTH